MALARGTAVHEWAERLDQGGDRTPLPDYRGYCQAYLACCEAIEPIWEEIEQPYDNGDWHGIPDRIGRLHGHDQLVIADLKTGAGRGRDTQLRVAIQLACYAMLRSPDSYEQALRVALFLEKSGQWRAVTYTDTKDFLRWRYLLTEAHNGNKIETDPETTPEQTGQNDRPGANANDHDAGDLPTSVSCPARSPDAAEDDHRPL